MTTGAESADGWQLLLADLVARKMGRPRLVISDGNTGLAAALDRLGKPVAVAAHDECDRADATGVQPPRENPGRPTQ